MTRANLAASLLATAAIAAPAWAETHTIAPGAGAQERLQEALILAEPGDEIVLAAGRFELTDGLSLDVDGVTLRGAGMAQTVLDFTGQQGAGEGLLVTSDNVTLRDFAVENAKGDGIKSKGADDIVYYRIRVTWTSGPLTTNGAYGIYPVESTGVLIDGCEVSGASDAGIYVGQSRAITVRYNLAADNVAGIEIENSRDALVTENLVARNTGGILVFDLPGLPVIGGGNVVISRNTVVNNDTPNFAPPGNIVAGVRRGTGIMVMANKGVTIVANRLDRNPTAQVMIIGYPQPFDDARYDPLPRDVVVADNDFERGGDDPQIDGKDALLAAFGGALPPVLWDGLGDMPLGLAKFGLKVKALNLNLPKQGAGLAEARPTLLELPNAVATPSKHGAVAVPRPGAPDGMEARLK
jgi:parallel beta-helix repeat protein